VVSYACPPIPGLLRKAVRRLSKPHRLVVLGEDWSGAVKELKRELQGA